MKKPPFPQGLRILVVEDEEGTVGMLTHELKTAFPDVHIASAGTVAEGEKELRQSVDSGCFYDVVTLDYKLPPDRLGQNPEPDHTLGLAFRRDSPQTLIVHITAYKEDVGLKEYQRDPVAAAEGGRLFVPKDKGWAQLLIKEIARGLVVYRIRRGFDELYRRERTADVRRAGQQQWAIGRSDRDRSLAVAEFCAYASQYWDLLSASLQTDLTHALGYARDEKGNHYLGVMDARAGERNDESGEEL